MYYWNTLQNLNEKEEGFFLTLNEKKNLTSTVKSSTILVLKIISQFWVILIWERYSLNFEFLHTNL